MALEFVSRQVGCESASKVAKRDPSTLAGVAVVHWLAARARRPRTMAVRRSCEACRTDTWRPVGSAPRAVPATSPTTTRSARTASPSSCAASASRRAERDDARERGLRRGRLYGRHEGRPAGDPGSAARARRGRAPVAGEGRGPARQAARLLHRLDVSGPDLRSWLDLSPHPWLTTETTVPKPPVKDETPDWLMDFVHWRLALNGDKKRRPPHLPPRIPETAWEAAVQVDRIANLMGPQDTFLDWAEWRRQGAKKAERRAAHRRRSRSPGGGARAAGADLQGRQDGEEAGAQEEGAGEAGRGSVDGLGASCSRLLARPSRLSSATCSGASTVATATTTCGTSSASTRPPARRGASTRCSS